MKQTLRVLGAVAAAPIACIMILAALNPSWLFTPIGWLDPWIYTALVNDWGSPDTWLTNYKTSRLGWLVPGWIFSPISGGYWGQILFGLFLLALTGLLAGAALGRLRGLRTGVVTAVLLSGWVSLQFLGGVSYHNQVSGIWIGATLLALTFAAPGDRRLTRLLPIIGLAGALFGLAVHANPIAVNLLPFIVIFGVAVIWPIRELGARRIGLGALSFVLGGLVATGVLMAAAAAVGRDPLFFRQGANLASGLLGNSAAQKTWWVELSLNWASLPRAGFAWHLILPVIGVAAATVVLIRWRGSWRRRAYGIKARLLASGVLATAVIYVGWNLIGQTSLAPDYFSYGLGVASAIGISLIVPEPPERSGEGEGAGAWVGMATGVTRGIAFALPMVLFPFLPGGVQAASGRTWLIALLVGLIALLVLAFPSRALAMVAVGMLLLGSANLLTAARYARTDYSWKPPPPACRGSQAQGYLTIRDANEWVDRVAPGFRATGGGLLWWPKRIESSVIPCTPNHPVGNLLISWLNTGYAQIPGFASGEPDSLRDVPEETLKALAKSQTVLGVVTDGPPAKSSDLEAHGFRIRCQRTKRLALEAPALTLCLGTVQRQGTPEGGG